MWDRDKLPGQHDSQFLANREDPFLIHRLLSLIFFFICRVISFTVNALILMRWSLLRKQLSGKSIANRTNQNQSFQIRNTMNQYASLTDKETLILRRVCTKASFDLQILIALRNFHCS